MMLINRYKLSL